MCVLIQVGCHMWWNNQVLSVCARMCVCVCCLMNKHTVTRRYDCSWCEHEQVQVGYRQVLGGRLIYTLVCICVCVHVCVCVHACVRCLWAGLWKGLGLIGSFQTSVKLTPMIHTTPGSTYARGCEACLSKLLLLFTRDDPEGPSITRKQKYTTQTWHASFIRLSSYA